MPYSETASKQFWNGVDVKPTQTQIPFGNDKKWGGCGDKKWGGCGEKNGAVAETNIGAVAKSAAIPKMLYDLALQSSRRRRTWVSTTVWAVEWKHYVWT